MSEGRLFHERMAFCGFGFYISRAYTSNEIFVYCKNVLDEKLYLENLSVNLSIIDGLNSFDFIED